MVSHIPYRAWCSHCVRGRGKSFAHHRVNRQEDPEEVPVVSIDRLRFLRRTRRASCRCRWWRPNACPGGEGPQEQSFVFTLGAPEHALVRDIKFLGYPSVVIKSDQEPAIKALAEAVKNSFAAKGGVRVQLENSPKGDDHGKSNGKPRRPLR